MSLALADLIFEIMEEEEVWKDIPGYEGSYQASSEGRIKSFLRGRDKILKSPISGGYQQVNLRRDGLTKHFHVHILVAMAFFEYSPHKGDFEIDHINGTQFGDGFKNLRIVTHRFNCTVGFSKDKHKFSSQYVGVSFDKKANRWRACISVDGEHKKIGSFQKEIEASAAYQKELLKITQK